MSIFHNPVHNIKKHLNVIVLVSLICAIVAGIVTLFLPRDFRADAQVLIISKGRYGIDPYTVVKSSERVGENLIQIMKTDDFFNKVMEQEGYGIDQSRFTDITEKKKRKRWTKTLQSSVVFGTGVLNISAYHPNAGQAQTIAKASSDALVTHAWEYVGGDVTVKIVNPPVVTKYATRPNPLYIAFAGLLLGAFFSTLLVSRR